jgi:hypothetical protein
MTGSFRYPPQSLVFGYVTSATGLAVSLGLLGWAQLAAPVAWAATASAALFLVYFGRTVCRQLTRVVLDEAGIRAEGPLGGAIRWEDLRLLELDYYSTRRDPEGRTMEGGWMQLKLRGARQTIRIDSELEGFAALASAAARAAAARGLALDAATLSNLEAIR